MNTQTQAAPVTPIGWLAATGRAACFLVLVAMLVGVVGQVLLAGLAVLVDAAYWPMHEFTGHLFTPLGYLLLFVSLFSRLRWATYGLFVLLMVLLIGQYVFLHAMPALGVPALRALHAVNALALFWLAGYLTRQLWQALRPGWQLPVGALATCTTVALASIALTGARNAADHTASTPVATPAAAALVNGNVQAGATLFAQRCAACHGTDATPRIGPGMAGLFAPGGPAMPPGVTYDGKLPNGEPITEQSVAAWIRSGGRGQIGVMPGFQLTDAELADVIAYLKTLER